MAFEIRDANGHEAPLAMAYVPMQRLESIYDPCQALRKGTLFAALYKPFCGRVRREEKEDA